MCIELEYLILIGLVKCNPGLWGFLRKKSNRTVGFFTVWKSPVPAPATDTERAAACRRHSPSLLCNWRGKTSSLKFLDFGEMEKSVTEHIQISMNISTFESIYINVHTLLQGYI